MTPEETLCRIKAVLALPVSDGAKLTHVFVYLHLELLRKLTTPEAAKLIAEQRNIPVAVVMEHREEVAHAVTPGCSPPVISASRLASSALPKKTLSFFDLYQVYRIAVLRKWRPELEGRAPTPYPKAVAVFRSLKRTYTAEQIARMINDFVLTERNFADATLTQLYLKREKLALKQEAIPSQNLGGK